MTVSERIARNVKAMCRYRKLNISDVEKQCGVARGYFSVVVKRQHTMQIDIVCAAAAALDMTVDELIRLDPQKAERERRIAELKAELVELEGESKEET